MDKYLNLDSCISPFSCSLGSLLLPLVECLGLSRNRSWSFMYGIRGTFHHHAVILHEKTHCFPNFRVVDRYFFFNKKKYRREHYYISDTRSFIAAGTHVAGCLIHMSCFGHRLYCYSAYKWNCFMTRSCQGCAPPGMVCCSSSFFLAHSLTSYWSWPNVTFPVWLSQASLLIYLFIEF